MCHFVKDPTYKSLPQMTLSTDASSLREIILVWTTEAGQEKPEVLTQGVPDPGRWGIFQIPSNSSRKRFLKRD